MEKGDTNTGSDHETGSTGSSLTLSLTPPLSTHSDKTPRKGHDESDISEHFSSVENDRSFQEILVQNFSLNLQDERLSQEPKPPSLNSTYDSNNSIISLNGLEKFGDSSKNVKSILEEILNNDQFKSQDSFAKEESLDIFANVNLDDAMLNSYNLGKSTDFNVNDFEELLAVKDGTITALTQELDSFRDMASNPSSNSLGTSTTEYRQYQEECHSKLVEYHNAITEKDELIKKLTESLHQSVLNRQELKQQSDHFKDEIAQLQAQLIETSEMLKSHKCDGDRAQNESLIAKHGREMEELRTYFEKKCADLEKNYSEEVFSQQSRKMSGSSSCSDDELPRDFVTAHPGPGGDADCKEPDYTRKDLEKLYRELKDVTSLLEGCDFPKVSDDDFTNLKSNLRKFDLKYLTKYDLSEMQNKYHAELEILREDYDNRVDVLRLEHNSKLKSLEEEIDELRTQIRANNSQIVSATAIQEVVSSGEFEIDEVVQSYERRLQEQVTLAKIDIIGALENQIQKLASSEDLDEDWPEELLRLKTRFAEKYQVEIEILKSAHESEVAHLKEEHLRTLNSALERARRRSLRDFDGSSEAELELLKERDSLKRQTSTLRHSIGELLKYFTQCEDELNNTLVEELLRQGLDRSATTLNRDEDFGLSESATRVHLAPNVDDLLNVIDSSNSTESDLESLDLRGELGSCLEKLKSDANAVLALTSNFADGANLKIGDNCRRSSVDNKVSSLTRQLIGETQIKNSLVDELKDARNLIRSLESERLGTEAHLERVLERQKAVEGDLSKARQKIAELIEDGHKEIVSEGYGEEGHEGVRGWVEALGGLSELQEKCRAITERPGEKDENLLNLLEEFARVSEKIVEEAKKERDDLEQQIDAADKKYKMTCRFLEDQAAEREQERDEAQKRIDSLGEILRDRDKDRANCERYRSEEAVNGLHGSRRHFHHVEQLEKQLGEKTKRLEEFARKSAEIEAERKEAIDKVHILREIIRSLEIQVEGKTRAEEELRSVVAELEALIQNRIDESARDDGEDKSGSPNVKNVEKLHRHIGDLEGQVQRLRLSTEIAGSEGAIKQIRNHLCEFETTLDRRTKDLEGFHSTCDSPISEEMSVRELIADPSSSIFDECEVPLQQLARLREKLVRHSRAEDAALKRTRDLEMRLDALKNDCDEIATERDILKKQIGDQLVLISSLQIRLDDQRIRAEHIEKQTNTSLEVRIYDLQTIVSSLEEKIASRDKTITLLNNVIDETKKRLRDREEDLARVKEDEILAQMQEELELVRLENSKLKARIDNEAQIVPNLVENIISDKNNDIELLREKLAETERHLDDYNSLSLDRNQLDALNRLRLSGVSFVDLLDEPDHVMRRIDVNRDESMQKSVLSTKNDRSVQKPVIDLTGDSEISTIEKIGPSHFFHSLQTSSGGKQNSTEKHVRFFEDDLRKDLVEKDRILKEYESRLAILDNLEEKVAILEETLGETEKALEKARVQFKSELEETEKDFKLQLAAKRLDLEEKDEEIKALNAKNLEFSRDRDCKDEQIINFKSQLSQKAAILNERNSEIANMKALNSDLSRQVDHLQHLLVEKEKLIKQMAEDSKALHVNLETIQAKMRENGNVVDLSRRLRDEQKKNWELLEEIHDLKAQLLVVKPVDEITTEVQKELELSQKLDESLMEALKDGAFDSVINEVKKLKKANEDLAQSEAQIKSKYDNLEKVCDDLKAKLISVEDELEKELLNLDRVRLEDGKLIEQMRLTLNSALDSENRLESAKKRLESELDDLKSKLPSSESTEYKDLENFELKTLKERNDFLNGELKSLSRLKSDVESNLKYAQDLTALKSREISALERKIEVMLANEREVRSKCHQLQGELDVKTKEVENSRALIDEMDQDRVAIKREMDNLNYRLEEALRTKMDVVKGNDAVPDKLMEKIRELNMAVKDNVQMVDLITRLTSEKTILEDRIIALEHRHVADFPIEDATSRANYLFAKYLRSESYRKALIWQKRYLQSLLWTWQSREFPIEIENRLGKSRGKERFRRVGLMVVALIRMKYLVKRWHSGKRIIQQRGVGKTDTDLVKFQVGKPVSSQNFTVPKEDFVPPSTSAFVLGGNEMRDVSLPWFGSSPPSKDSRIRRNRTEPLTAPGLLTKYVERFNQIQERLGMASGPSG